MHSRTIKAFLITTLIVVAIIGIDKAFDLSGRIANLLPGSRTKGA